MIDDPDAAFDAVLCQFAMDMGTTPCDPPPDPRLTAAGFRLIGHLCGIDEIAGVSQDVCYGYLAERAGQCVVVARGTADGLEWFEDAEFALQPHPLGGRVESGFYGIYQRLTFQPLGGAKVGLIAGLAHALNGAAVRVIGHSLGAALAQYIALELAQALAPRPITATLLASPRAGEAVFRGVFGGWVRNYKLYNRELDLVPHLPAGLSYATLPMAQWLTSANSQAIIRPGLANRHHAIGYAASLCYRLCDWKQFFEGSDAQDLNCIAGPAPGAPQGDPPVCPSFSPQKAA
jgi:hypothetical protein